MGRRRVAAGTDVAGLNGGTAGSISLTATGGSVIVGPNRGVSLSSQGGYSLAASGAGNAGNGGAITVSGTSVSIDRVFSNGGDTTNAAATAGAGANLSVTATSGNITIYGINDLFNAAGPQAQVVARSGVAGVTTPGTYGSFDNTAVGTANSTSGNITFTAQNLILATSSTNGVNTGSNVEFSARASTPGTSGIVQVNANVNATTANVESVSIGGSGTVTVNGSIGNNVALNTLYIGSPTSVGRQHHLSRPRSPSARRSRTCGLRA